MCRVSCLCRSREIHALGRGARTDMAPRGNDSHAGVHPEACAALSDQHGKSSLSERKWPHYTQQIGEFYVVWNAPKTHRKNVHAYAASVGKSFRVTRLDRFEAKSPIM